MEHQKGYEIRQRRIAQALCIRAQEAREPVQHAIESRFCAGGGPELEARLPRAKSVRARCRCEG
jgi:hypothetical protein